MAFDSRNDKEWNRQIEYMRKKIEQEEQEKNNEIKFLQLSYGNYVLLDDYVKLQQENQQLKKQKDDVVEYINNNSLYEEEYDYDYEENPYLSRISDEQARTDLLRMLGEIDVED